MYTIKTMTMRDHTDTSWDELFGCEDDERRNYKIMYGSTLVDQELTFSEAKEMKAYYEAEDAYEREEAERYERYPESFIKL